MRPDQDPTLFRRARRSTAVVIAGIALFGCGSGKDKDTTAKPGCQPFTIYAQNRWPGPDGFYGAAVRAKPSKDAAYAGPGFQANQQIIVDGWIDTNEPVYAQNPEPFNNGIWFHLDEPGRHGWVSFPGVRGAETEPDPTRQSNDGGTPAPTTPECQTTYRPATSN